MRGRAVTLTWQHDPTVHAPAKYRRACRYTAFIPDPLQGWNFKLDADVAGVVAEAESIVRELNARTAPALAPLARLLLRTESIASSKVEGIGLGARELARAEARLKTGRKVGSTVAEILSNIDAMQLAVDEAAAADDFSPDQILRIHGRLMESWPTARIGGHFRAVQNWIGGNDYNPCGADFVPPPPEYVPDLLADLCEAIDDDLLPPLVQAAIVHGQFETIHPFDDGNGRTGRALIHVVLRRRGVTPAYVPPISVVLAGSKETYIGGLVDFRNGEVGKWVDQFAAVTVRAGRLAAQYLDAVTDLMGQWRERLAAAPDAPRADAAAWAIIDVLPAHPIVTGSVAAAATGRSKPQVYRALEQLEAAGILERVSTGRRNRSWEAAGLLDLIEGLEAGELPATRR